MYKQRLLNMYLRRNNLWLGRKTDIRKKLPHNSIHICTKKVKTEIYKYYIINNNSFVHAIEMDNYITRFMIFVDIY